MLELFKKDKTFPLDEIAKMLKTSPENIKKFEAAYAAHALNAPMSDNLFEVNAKQAAQQNAGIVERPEDVEAMINAIVKDLVAMTKVWTYDGVTATVDKLGLPAPKCEITGEQVNALPEQLRPQLTANLMKIDVPDSYVALLEMYHGYLNTNNPKRKMGFYHRFRQGLDILDLDPIMYEIINMNRNSMGYWLPPLVDAIKLQSFFKVPKTKIIKVPLTLLQLTRCDYNLLTRTTLDIVDRYCQKVFELKENEDYFIKTGTYSSKFDFRNAHVHGAKEVRELGEYLLFIHYQALQMASPLSSPCIYGASTTTEWVVREFIPDKENNPCIYKGLPLHTEYRVFIDCDTQKVIGVNPYWDPNVMKQRFGHSEDSNSPHNIHDYVIYQMHEECLMNRYNENVRSVVAHVENMLPNLKLEGQWSVDIMQNGDDFWLIDMGVAENSAFYKECVPEELRMPYPESWLPELDFRK